MVLLVSAVLDGSLGLPFWIPTALWLASGALAFHRPTEDLLARYLLGLRRPMPPEAARLEPVWREVTAVAGVDGAVYQLWVEESDDLNAYAAAGHIVGVTRFALEQLPSGQLAAVLAHELGHHMRRSRMVVTAEPLVRAARPGRLARPAGGCPLRRHMRPGVPSTSPSVSCCWRSADLAPPPPRSCTGFRCFSYFRICRQRWDAVPNCVPIATPPSSDSHRIWPRCSRPCTRTGLGLGGGHSLSVASGHSGSRNRHTHGCSRPTPTSRPGCIICGAICRSDRLHGPCGGKRRRAATPYETG